MDNLNRAFNTYGLLGGQQTNYVTATGYAPHGAVNTRWYGNTVVPAVGFNSRLQPDGIYVALNNSPNSYLWVKNFDWGTTGNNGTLLAASEEYNPAGPAPASALTWVYQGYGYDGVNRLNWIGDNGWNRSLNYDAYGNMWVQSNTGGPESGNTPVTNVFTGSTNRMATAGYDASGNQLSVGGNSVTYDAENRATATVEPGVGTEIYSYDGNGQRTWKGDPGSAVGYIYDAFGQLVAEHTTSTVVTGPSCQTCYLVYDQVGSPSLVTDQNGTVVARHDYLPFGEEVPANTAGRTAQWGPGNDNLPAKFTGQMRDAGTGMDYFGARYYSAALGRFTSPDPGNAGADLTNPQSWNGYGYVWNDPLDATDPSGLIAQANPPQQTDDNTDAFGPIGGWAWWWNVEWRTLTGTVPSYSSGGGGGGSSVATSVGVYGPQQTTPGSGLTMQVGMAVQTSPAIASPTKNGTKQPDLLNWTKLGSCLASSTANHYGLTASAGVSGLLALPIPKAIVPPYKVIGTTTTNILSIVGRYVDIDVPLTTIAGRTSGNLLRIAGRANPYVFAGLLAIDAGVIGSNTYNCYQQSGQTGGQHTANGSGAPQ